jgi:hypothetical protein
MHLDWERVWEDKACRVVPVNIWVRCAIGAMTRFMKIFGPAGVLFWGRVDLFGGLDCVMKQLKPGMGIENGGNHYDSAIFVVGCTWSMEPLHFD